jgi:hypothetical protein
LNNELDHLDCWSSRYRALHSRFLWSALIRGQRLRAAGLNRTALARHAMIVFKISKDDISWRVERDHRLISHFPNAPEGSCGGYAFCTRHPKEGGRASVSIAATPPGRRNADPYRDLNGTHFSSRALPSQVRDGVVFRHRPKAGSAWASAGPAFPLYGTDGRSKCLISAGFPPAP